MKIGDEEYKNDNNNPSQSNSHIYKEIKNYILLSNYDKALQKLDELKEKISSDPMVYVHYNLLLSEIHINQTKYDLALELIQKMQITLNQHNWFLLSVDALILVSEIFYRQGKFEECITEIDKGEKILDNATNKGSKEIAQRMVELLNRKGTVYLDLGETDLALKCLEECISLSKVHNLLEYASRSLHNIGVMQHTVGNLERALEVYMQSYEIDKKLNNSLGIAISYNNIGEIYRIQGELDNAIHYYSESLKKCEEVKTRQISCHVLHNLGLIYSVKGEEEVAEDYFIKSLKISEEIGNEYDIAETLLYIIKLYAESGEQNKAQIYLDRLANIKKNSTLKQVEQFYLLSEAFLLKTSKRAIKRAQAQQSFQIISEDELLDHEIVVLAMLNLYEMLLQELTTSSNEEVLEELKELTDKLLKISKTQNSFFTLAETYLLQSKLALLELDVNKSKQLLTQAEVITKEKNFVRLGKKISEEYDFLLSHISKWENFIEKNASYSERVELARLEEMVVKMIRKRIVDVSDIPEEEPVLLIILTESGITIFAKNFKDSQELDQYLVGGFLTAINNFSRDAFSVTGTIERIKHQDYTLLMKAWDPFIISYVFKGQSYFALQKLENFISHLVEDKTILETLNKRTIETIDEKMDRKITSIAEEIFTNPKKT